MLNTSTASSKPTGISNKQYQGVQDVKAEQDFKYDIVQKLQSLQVSGDAIKECMLGIESYLSAGIKNCQIAIENEKAACIDRLKEFRIILDGFEYHLRQAALWRNDVQEYVSNLVLNKEYSERVVDIYNTIRDIREEAITIRQDLGYLVDKVKADFNAKLIALKEEIYARPTGLPELRKDLEEKIHLAEMNGQNSVIRASNNERQLLMADRKIDQLYQLYKKLELDRQEIV